MHWQSGYVATVEFDRPAVRLLKTGDHVKQSRLACAIRADNARDAAPAEGQSAIVQRGDTAEVLFDVADVEKGAHRPADP